MPAGREQACDERMPCNQPRGIVWSVVQAKRKEDPVMGDKTPKRPPKPKKPK
jgi:hypothetical protein